MLAVEGGGQKMLINFEEGQVVWEVVVLDMIFHP